MKKGFSGNIVIENNDNIREFETDNKRRTKCYSKSIDMLVNSLYLLFDKLYWHLLL